MSISCKNIYVSALSVGFSFVSFVGLAICFGLAYRVEFVLILMIQVEVERNVFSMSALVFRMLIQINDKRYLVSKEGAKSDFV